MQFEPKSIADQIQALAQLTGAPESFIAQVRALFERKGISLLTDSAPYINALEHAFRREHSIRTCRGTRERQSDTFRFRPRRSPNVRRAQPERSLSDGARARRYSVRQRPSDAFDPFLESGKGRCV